MAYGRKTGGRQKGTPNKRTAEVEELIASLSDEGASPLEVMLKAMKMALDNKDLDKAHAIAKDAAPYVHPRYSAVQHSGQIDGKSYVVRLPEPVKSVDEWMDRYAPSHARNDH